MNTETGVIAWFTRNTVAANLLMVLILVSGLLVLPVVKKEVFPEMSARIVTVTVAYPGATPEEVEESICRRVEEVIQGLSGIKRITSVAEENGGIVSSELLPGFDENVVVGDIKNRVDGIDTFPEEAEKPIVQSVILRRQVINVAISGDVDEDTLKRLGQRVYDDLVAMPAITQVELVNTRPREITIEVAEDALRRWGVTFDQVANAIRRSSLDLPGGSLRTEGGEILLRSLGQARQVDEFERLVILSRPDGTRVTLGQIATVIDGFAETDQSARFDGKPSVLVQVYRVGDQSAFEISQVVRDYCEEMQASLPEGIELTPWRDNSEMLRSRVELLARNAMQGLVLVFVVLALFLRFKLAFWVSMGIPTSFLGAIALMPTFDVSINMVSLFAFIVVLGIVVDDAIVVGENVFKHLRQGKSGVDAAIIGSKQVAVPVTFGVMTTVAAFWPMLNVDGNAREIWRQIPLIVIPCLLFSLIESKLILPAHLSHQHPTGFRPEPRGIRRLWAPMDDLWRRIQLPFSRGMEWFAAGVYRPALAFLLHWRYVTVAAGVVVLSVSLALVGAGHIRFNYLPNVEGDNVVAMLTFPLGTPPQRTELALRRIEQAGRQIEADLGEENVIRHVLTSIGSQPYLLEVAANRGQVGASTSGSHFGEVNIQLAPSEERTISSEEVMRRWREAVGVVPEAVELTFTSSLMSTGADIDIQMSHPDIDRLELAAEEVKSKLRTFAGVSDVTDSLRQGKREVKLAIKPEAESVGITLVDLARQVRQGFYGEEVQRIQRGREEMKVMLRYPAEARRALGDLETMRVRTAGGDEVPFSAVAAADYGRGYSAIKRADLARAVNVTAEVDPKKGNTAEVLKKLDEGFVADLRQRHPGLQVSYEGDSKEQRIALESLMRGAIVAMFIIYGLMAVPFRSYLQPLLVMTAIPFGLVGAIWGHVFMGLDVSIISALGLVALVGVVVNDSLVLVDYVNRHRDDGHRILDAVRHSGVARFRPILLTSLTTFASLTPMLLERSVQARFLVPMAVSLAFGVMFATAITLVIVPCGYVILEDLKAVLRRVRGLPAPERIASGRPAEV